MTEAKWPRGPALLGWGDLCHSSVWGFNGFKLELELRGRTVSLSWLIAIEPRPGATFQTEAETMKQSRDRGSTVETEARPCEAEARPSQLKKLPRGICLESRQMPRGLDPSLTIGPWRSCTLYCVPF